MAHTVGGMAGHLGTAEVLLIKAHMIGGDSAEELSFGMESSFADLQSAVKRAFGLPDLELKIVFGDRVLGASIDPSITLSCLGFKGSSDITVCRTLTHAGIYGYSARGPVHSDVSVGDWTETKVLRLGDAGDCQFWRRRTDPFLEIRIIDDVRSGTYTAEDATALCTWTVVWTCESWADDDMHLDEQLNIPLEAWAAGEPFESEERLPFESDDRSDDRETSQDSASGGATWKKSGSERCCLTAKEMIALGVPAQAAHELDRQANGQEPRSHA